MQDKDSIVALEIKEVLSPVEFGFGNRVKGKKKSKAPFLLRRGWMIVISILADYPGKILPICNSKYSFLLSFNIVAYFPLAIASSYLASAFNFSII